MALIETTDISQKYDGREVLKNINLKIDKAEVFTLIGPTGAGKTTLIRILDLLESPCSGRVLFDGVEVTISRASQIEARRRMSYVQQRPIVFNMNVFDNVACGLRWRRMKSAAIKQKTEKALEMVGMTDYRKRNARTLSGGETQRVAIARALVTEPEVLFLDEPTANMDPISTAKIEEVLADIISEQRIAIIMATHNMSQGQRMASTLGVLINGELLQTGSVSDIFNMPQSREVAEFVGVENMLSGIVVEKEDDLVTIDLDGGTIEAISEFSVGDKVYAIIRPEDITFTLAKEASTARNVFEGKMITITTVGPLVRIELDCGFSLLGVITRKSADELDLSLGQMVYASFKATAVHTIKRWG